MNGQRLIVCLHAYYAMITNKIATKQNYKNFIEGYNNRIKTFNINYQTQNCKRKIKIKCSLKCTSEYFKFYINVL